MESKGIRGLRGEIEIPHNFIIGSLHHLQASSLITLQTAAYAHYSVFWDSLGTFAKNPF